MSSGTVGCICGGNGVKVTRLTLGALCTCLVLGLSRDSPMGGQKSAEGIVGDGSGKASEALQCLKAESTDRPSRNEDCRRPEQVNPARCRHLDG